MTGCSRVRAAPCSYRDVIREINLLRKILSCMCLGKISEYLMSRTITIIHHIIHIYISVTMIHFFIPKITLDDVFGFIYFNLLTEISIERAIIVRCASFFDFLFLLIIFLY